MRKSRKEMNRKNRIRLAKHRKKLLDLAKKREEKAKVREVLVDNI